VRERPRSRVFNCALVPHGYQDKTVPMRYSGPMSLVRGARGSEEADSAHVRAGTKRGWARTYDLWVPARTLSSILDEVGAEDIDLLVLDVEGYEPQALAGLDLSRHTPRFMLVEILDALRTRTEVEELIGGKYETVRQLSPTDVLYRRR
jgi:FkbM family methyltransferase